MTIKEIGTLMTTSAIGGNKGEAAVGSIAAFLGFIATDYLGGWDAALKIMVYLMIADYISGVLGAYRTKTLSSDVMFWGGIRKAVVLGVIALAVLIDQFMGAEAPIFRTLALYFYAGREGLSVVENLGPLGVPLPPALTNFLKQLQQKGESK